MNNQNSSFVHILQRRALQQPDRLAYEFVKGDELNGLTLTYGKLGADVLQLAAGLMPYAVTDAPVLIVLPPGLELIRAFFAVISMRGIATLIEPQVNERQSTHIMNVIADLQPRLIITSETLALGVSELAGDMTVVSLETFSELTPMSPGDLPVINGDEPCMIQYTSGSSGMPKGVVLSHSNLMQNSLVIQQSFFHTSKSYGVIWLPPYHDMGLIGGILQPLFAGFPVTLMSPRTFLQKPVRLLRLISAKKASTSGGPNFAYDLCTKKITDDELKGINLSSWQVAFCGAEPVQAQTLDNFARRFAKQNFMTSSFLPCYGLAESTLFVTGALKLEEPLVLNMDRAGIAEGVFKRAKSASESVPVVSSGFPYYLETLLVVDPDTKEQCRINEIGEIWVSSPCTAKGYWRRDDDGTFNATLSKPDGKTYLRTGDLGFIHRNQLFITGRIKEIIIINGRNHFPQHIENSVREAFSIWPGWKEMNVVAAACHQEGRELLAVVLEIPRGLLDIMDTNDMISLVRKKISEDHHVQAEMICVVQPGEIEHTRNGKPQRYKAAQSLQLRKYRELAFWSAVSSGQEAQLLPEDEIITGEPADFLIRESLNKAQSALEMQDILMNWLAATIAEEIEMPAADIDPELHFGLYGLDSISAVVISDKVEKLLGNIEVSSTALWDYPNLKSISWHIIELMKDKNLLLA
ncbi:MAG TPA: AMP-binding protein [Mucilaginibacter sp.]|nr:AMP-binding protein [Mucilaginibacter sp.]